MTYDAIVIGAGPAGNATALALALQGRNVALIERSDYPRRKVCGEFMSAVNLHILDRLGVGADIRRLAGPEVRRVALYASGPSIEASMPKAQRDSFGRALGRDVLDTIMLEKARSIGVRCFSLGVPPQLRRTGINRMYALKRARKAECFTAAISSRHMGRGSLAD